MWLKCCILLLVSSYSASEEIYNSILTNSLTHSDYGRLPDLSKYLGEDPSSGLAEISRHPSDLCKSSVVIKKDDMALYAIGESTALCSTFFSAEDDAILSMEAITLNLNDCDEEYLFVSDGLTLESSLCGGEYPIYIDGVHQLFLQYERRGQTPTQFNVTIRAMAVETDDTKRFKRQVLNFHRQENLKQICQVCGTSTVSGVGSYLVVGEEDSPPAEFPWMVAILTTFINETGGTGFTSCAGSVIDKYHIMTAAHCFLPNTTFVVISAGAPKEVSETSRHIHEAENWQRHPLYFLDDKLGHAVNDIAIVTLKRPLEFSDAVRPICISDLHAYDYHDVIGAGFGLMENNTFAGTLQKSKLNIRPLRECRKFVQESALNFFDFVHICLHSTIQQPLALEEGGPIVLKNNNQFYQVAIVSSKFNRRLQKSKGSYAISTRISSVYRWIEQVLQHNYTCS